MVVVCEEVLGGRRVLIEQVYDKFREEKSRQSISSALKELETRGLIQRPRIYLPNGKKVLSIRLTMVGKQVYRENKNNYD